MDVKEIEQLIKDLPEELYEIPRYGKLHGNVKIFHGDCVQLRVLLSTGLNVISINVFEDMDFTLRLHNMNETINYLKTWIKNIASRIECYLNILGFNCINSWS